MGALSDPYSSSTNFNVKPYLSEDFPQHHKTDKEVPVHSMNDISINQFNLTESDVQKIIENAYESAKENVAMSIYQKKKLSKSSSKSIDFTEDIDYDEDSDVDEFQDEEKKIDSYDDKDQMSSNTTDEDEDEENIVASGLSDIDQQNFQGCRIFAQVNPQHLHKYFRIRIGSSLKYLHKKIACWLLTDNKNRLSSDRLIRVRKTERQ